MWQYFKKIYYLYNRSIRGHREEPRFLILTSFIFTFIFARIIAYSIDYQVFPGMFHIVYFGDLHIHHLVFGIILLLIAGLIRIPQFGPQFSRLSSIVYGMGAALTLDEFALWLHLRPDTYWGEQGRISIDAGVLFILIVLSTLWHGVFWRKLFKYTLGLFFRRRRMDIRAKIARNLPEV